MTTRSIHFFLLGLCFLFCSCVNNNNNPYRHIDMGDYVITPLTRGLLDTLGGESELKQYQLYLSSPLSLSVLETSSQRKDKDEDIVQVIHDKYLIEFDTNTPGALKDLYYEHDSGFYYLDRIDVYFDERDDAYLSFKRKYKEGVSFPIYELYYYGYSVTYEGRSWKPSSNNVFLVLHLDKSVYERLHNKKAKGRIIN